MRKKLLAATVAGIALAVGAVPASLAWAADTTVTFTVTATDNFQITVPTTVAISTSSGTDPGTVNPGDDVSGQIGPVTIEDQRSQAGASWVASVIGSDFVTPPPPAAQVSAIPVADVDYWSGPATASTNVNASTPGQPTAADAVTIDVSQTAFSMTAADGNNSITWNPTLIVHVPSTAVAGSYSGTVTHTVV